MSSNDARHDRFLEADVIGAALRYTAVADWLEALPVRPHGRDGVLAAMTVFNRVEAELRRSGSRLLRRLGKRRQILEQLLALHGLSVDPAEEGETAATS